MVFSKFASAITDPGDDIHLPEIVKVCHKGLPRCPLTSALLQELDFEVEMTIVIGKTAKNVPVGGATR